MSSTLPGAFAVLATRGIALAASLLATVITARTLGPTGRGEYYLVIAVGALAIQFGTVGLHASNAYLVAQERTRAGALLVNSVWVSLVAGTLVAIVAGCAHFLGDAAARRSGLLYWLIVYVPAGLFFQLANSVLLGCGRIAWYNTAQVALSFLTTLALAAMAFVDATPQSLVAAFASASLVVAVGMLVVMRRAEHAPWHFDGAMFRQGWTFAAKSFVVSVLGFLVLRTNVFLLERLQGATALGFYSVAMQFLDLISLAPASIAAVLFPILVRSEAAWSETKRHVVLVAAVVGVACLLLAICVEPVIRLVFGEEFLPARSPVVWILPAAAFSAVTTIFSQYLAARGLPVSVLIVWGGALAVGTAGGLILIPQLGATGAAVSLSISCAVAAAAMGTLAALRSRTASHDSMQAIRP